MDPQRDPTLENYPCNHLFYEGPELYQGWEVQSVPFHVDSQATPQPPAQPPKPRTANSKSRSQSENLVSKLWVETVSFKAYWHPNLIASSVKPQIPNPRPPKPHTQSPQATGTWNVLGSTGREAQASAAIPGFRVSGLGFRV